MSRRHSPEIEEGGRHSLRPHDLPVWERGGDVWVVGQGRGGVCIDTTERRYTTRHTAGKGREEVGDLRGEQERLAA